MSSSRLCLDDMEKTSMKALPGVVRLLCLITEDNQSRENSPFETESLCMAGNWWLPAVSVICMVQTALLLLITFLNKHSQPESDKTTTYLYVSSIVGV